MADLDYLHIVRAESYPDSTQNSQPDIDSESKEHKAEQQDHSYKLHYIKEKKLS